MKVSYPWTAEHEVDAELARALIREQFPGIAARHVELLGRGWDNIAWLIDGAFVFRFPRKQSAVALLETEARVLPPLAPHLTLPIPVPEWVGRPGPRFPWPFVGYRRIEGEPASAARLTDAQRSAAARQLGEFLARLHALPVTEFTLPDDLLERDDFVQRLPLLAERLRVLRERGVIDDVAPWVALFDRVGPAERSHVPCVVHGDLYARHLLVDTARRISGVIDWGDVHRGDPAMDLMMMYAFLPAHARNDFVRAYGPIDDRTRRVARLRATFHAVSVAWYGSELPDEELLHEGLVAMRNVLAE